MIFDIDRELEDDDFHPWMTLFFIIGFLAVFFRLVGDKMGPEL